MGGKGREGWRQKYLLSNASFGIITLLIFEMIVKKVRWGEEASSYLSGRPQIQTILEKPT